MPLGGRDKQAKVMLTIVWTLGQINQVHQILLSNLLVTQGKNVVSKYQLGKFKLVDQNSKI